MSEKVYPIAVIGGGAAGTMAALRSVLNNDETLLLPGSPKDKKRSRAFWVTRVENMPGHLSYKKGIEEPNREVFDFLSVCPFKEKFHWMKNRGAVSIEKRPDGLFAIVDNRDDSYVAQHVIYCTGLMDVQPLIQGKIEPVFPYANKQSIDYCLRCDGHHTYEKHTGIIGHSNGAA